MLPDQRQAHVPTTTKRPQQFYNSSWLYSCRCSNRLRATAANSVTKDESSDVVSNQAPFAYDLTNVKPHQHLCGHQTVPQCFLKEKKKKNTTQFRTFAPATAAFLAPVTKLHAWLAKWSPNSQDNSLSKKQMCKLVFVMLTHTSTGHIFTRALKW